MMPYSSAVSVVAGGWSFTQVDQSRIPGRIIAINDAAVHLKRRPDEIVTMDRLWTEHRWAWLVGQRIHTHARRSALQNVGLHSGDVHAKIFDLIDTVDWPAWLNMFDCDNETVEFEPDRYPESVHGFSRYPSFLNGTNSGTCGLNRAWQMRPKDLYLFGFDMKVGPNGEKHWWPDYPYAYTTSGKRFKAWVGEFDRITKQFKDIGTKVWNVSEYSALNHFPKLRPNELPKAAA